MSQFESRRFSFSEDSFGLALNEPRTPISEASNYTFNPEKCCTPALSPLAIPFKKEKSRWDSEIKLFILQEEPISVKLDLE